MKQNEGSLLKYVTRGENQNEILPRSDNALNQTAERESSVNLKDVNRGEDKLQVAQSDVSDEEEDNSNLSSPTSDNKEQYEPSHNNTIRCDRTEPQQVYMTDAGIWPEISMIHT